MKNEIDEDYYDIQKNMATILINVFKKHLTAKSQKDKNYSIERLKKPMSKWRIENSIAESVVEEVFSMNPKTQNDLIQVLRKEFSRVKIGGRYIH